MTETVSVTGTGIAGHGEKSGSAGSDVGYYELRRLATVALCAPASPPWWRDREVGRLVGCLNSVAYGVSTLVGRLSADHTSSVKCKGECC